MRRNNTKCLNCDRCTHLFLPDREWYLTSLCSSAWWLTKSGSHWHPIRLPFVKVSAGHIPYKWIFCCEWEDSYTIWAFVIFLAQVSWHQWGWNTIKTLSNNTEVLGMLTWIGGWLSLCSDNSATWRPWRQIESNTDAYAVNIEEGAISFPPWLGSICVDRSFNIGQVRPESYLISHLMLCHSCCLIVIIEIVRWVWIQKEKALVDSMGSRRQWSLVWACKAINSRAPWKVYSSFERTKQ